MEKLAPPHTTRAETREWVVLAFISGGLLLMSTLETLIT